MRYCITALFRDPNQPAVSSEADTWPQATAAASHLFQQFAGLKSVRVDDRVQAERHVAVPTAGGLEYLFTCPIPTPT